MRARNEIHLVAGDGVAAGGGAKPSPASWREKDTSFTTASY